MNLIFDFGGVVFRWEPLRLLRQAWPQRVSDDASAREWKRALFQGYSGDWARFDMGLIGAPELAERIEARIGVTQAEVHHLLAQVHEHLAPIEATVHWLEELATAGHRLFYLSNMPPPMADELERRHAFLRRFENGVFSGRVQLAKPDPAVFHLALQRFGLRPDEAVFFDDHPPNIERARQLGLHAVLFRDAAEARDELQRRGLD